MTMTELAVGPDGPDGPDAVRYTVEEMLIETGATYRQLDYWVRCGYLTPDRRVPMSQDVEPGSGYERYWTHRDMRIARAMIRLIGAGIIVAEAAKWATDAVDHGTYTVNSGGVELIWQTPEEHL